MSEQEQTTSANDSDPEAQKIRAVLRDPRTYGIIGAAQKVHRTLGPGFTESTYQCALEKEFALRGIPFDSQREFQVWYEGTLCGSYKPDLVVDRRAIVELKAVADFAPEHWAQVISYLKASGLRIGLLINFGNRSLQVKRFRN